MVLASADDADAAAIKLLNITAVVVVDIIVVALLIMLLQIIFAPVNIIVSVTLH